MSSPIFAPSFIPDTTKSKAFFPIFELIAKLTQSAGSPVRANLFFSTSLTLKGVFRLIAWPFVLWLYSGATIIVSPKFESRLYKLLRPSAFIPSSLVKRILIYTS